MTTSAQIVDFARRRPLLTAVGAAVILFLAVHVLWSGKIAPGLLAPEHGAMPNVPRARVTSETLPVRHEVIGTIQSLTMVDAASRVAATVKEIKVRAGQHVQAGQLLVALDSADLSAQLRAAESAAAASRAELVRASADEKRFRALLAKGSVTPHEFDAAEAAWQSAKARTDQAEANAAAARAALSYTAVRAPVDGIVAERLVEPGDLATPGRPLIKMYQSAALRVELQIPEEMIDEVKPGSAIMVHVDAVGLDIPATVNEVVPMANAESRTFIARAPMPSDKGLKPGLFAKATLRTGAEKMLVVPSGAIERIGQLDTVQVIAAGTVERRQVSVGRVIDGRAEILAGLHDGDEVLVTSPDEHQR